VSDLKNEFLRNAEPLSKVAFDNKLHVIRNALGTHTTISRVQGSKLKAKREIRVASLFREVPLEWLRMIVVHELAHMKEREHDKAFYQLCAHMEPDYHQLEFDLRLYLTHLESGGPRLWSPAA
jgi:predicted metal-dependent hydrolase